MSRTVVHLLRHGEVHNPHSVLYGRLPGYGLSDAGVEMAHAAARHLKDADVTAVRSSPLERARMTATPLAELFGVAITIDERLTEAANAFEGKTFSRRMLREDGNWRYLRNPFRPSWGEPYEQIASRMLAAVTAARDAARGHEAVCVSHQLPIWTMRRHLEGARLWHRPDRRQCALASITSVEYEGDRLVGVSYCEPTQGVVS